MRVFSLIIYRLFPKIVDIQALMKYYDTDHDGNITYEEFLRGLRYHIINKIENLLTLEEQKYLKRFFRDWISMDQES